MWRAGLLSRAVKETIPGRSLAAAGWLASFGGLGLQVLGLDSSQGALQDVCSFHISSFCVGTRHAGLGPTRIISSQRLSDKATF